MKSRQKGKKKGSSKERVFGCDLQEQLQRSGQEGKEAAQGRCWWGAWSFSVWSSPRDRSSAQVLMAEGQWLGVSTQEAEEQVWQEMWLSREGRGAPVCNYLAMGQLGVRRER